MSSYLTVGKNVWICSEKSGFCFSIFWLSWDTKENKCSQNVVISPDSMHPKYFILECCLICISPYFTFSFMTFFILNFVPKSIDLVLPLPKWILSLLLTNQSQMLSKSLFSYFSISLISLC